MSEVDVKKRVSKNGPEFDFILCQICNEKESDRGVIGLNKDKVVECVDWCDTCWNEHRRKGWKKKKKKEGS